MTGDQDAFARLRMDGERFEGARVPLESLEELQRYRVIVLAAAKMAWESENPDTPLPIEFERGFSLVLSDVEEGSATSVLERPATSQYDRYYELGREEVEREFALLAEQLADNSDNSDDESGVLAIRPVEIRLLHLPEFQEFGSSLGADDNIFMSSPTAQAAVVVNESVRQEVLAPLVEETERELALAAQVVPPVMRTVEEEVAGRLVAVNAERTNFVFDTLLYGEVSGRYKEPSLTEDLREVLNSKALARVVRIAGRLRFWDDHLYRILEAKSVEVFESDDEPWSRRLVELAGLPRNWNPDERESEPISFSALDAARAILSESREIGHNPPNIFPMSDGGVQLEWATSARVTSIEISSILEYYMFDLVVGDRITAEHESDALDAVLDFVRGLNASAE